MRQKRRYVVLICAAGVGSRMKAGRPKQYLLLGQKTMLRHTVSRFTSLDWVDDVVVVVSPEDPYIDAIASVWSEKVRVLKVGGAERAHSVCNGLDAAAWGASDWVFVHDAARPCVTEEELVALKDALQNPRIDGAILAQPMADTVKCVNAQGLIEKTLDRSTLRRAATPQAFRVGDLRVALKSPSRAITDDASAMEALGKKVQVVTSLPTNFKVTEPLDREMASFLLGNTMTTKIRVGQGYDSHRLVEGRPLILAGVNVPFRKGLDGHSDADVILHAVTDALLGATGMGDIGRHFPPTDPQWKGADSAMLLRRIVRKARAQGYEIINCDTTLVAERPKLLPYKPQMRANLARFLEIDVDCVSLKAKTNEKMDAVGRQEGMMAFAVMLVEKVR